MKRCLLISVVLADLKLDNQLKHFHYTPSVPVVSRLQSLLSSYLFQLFFIYIYVYLFISPCHGHLFHSLFNSLILLSHPTQCVFILRHCMNLWNATSMQKRHWDDYASMWKCLVVRTFLLSDSLPLYFFIIHWKTWPWYLLVRYFSYLKSCLIQLQLICTFSQL